MVTNVRHTYCVFYKNFDYVAGTHKVRELFVVRSTFRISRADAMIGGRLNYLPMSCGPRCVSGIQNVIFSMTRSNSDIIKS